MTPGLDTTSSKPTVILASVITVIAATLLAAIIAALVLTVITRCRHKFSTGGVVESVLSTKGKGQGNKERVAVTNPNYMDIEATAHWKSLRANANSSQMVGIDELYKL